MIQIGFSLIDKNGVEVTVWGDTVGTTVGLPEVITLPNGDRVYCPNLETDYGGLRLVPRYVEFGDTVGVVYDGKSIITTKPLPVPEQISDRQFFQLLALQKIITEAEALAAVKTGEMPPALKALVANLSAEQQFGAEMLLSGATVFERNHPLTLAMGSTYGWTTAEIDQFWRTAATL